MCSSLKFLSFSPVQTFMVIDGLPFQSFYLIFKLNAFLFLLLFLLMGPLQDSLCLLLVKGEFLLLLLVVLVHLCVLHLELRYVVTGFVLVCTQVKFYDWTVTDRKRFSLFHTLSEIRIN
jgi:hypothetical protein